MTGHNLRTCEKRKSVSTRKQHTIKLYRKHARLLKEKRKVLKDSHNQLNELKQDRTLLIFVEGRLTILWINYKSIWKN